LDQEVEGKFDCIQSLPEPGTRQRTRPDIDKGPRKSGVIEKMSAKA